MRQNLLVSNRGQITLPASVRKRLGIQSGGIVTLEERDNVVVLRPAAVIEIETYSDEEIAQWDKEDRLEPAEWNAISKRLRKRVGDNRKGAKSNRGGSLQIGMRT
jgi:antitoxin PrlF